MRYVVVAVMLGIVLAANVAAFSAMFEIFHDAGWVSDTLE